MLEAGQRLEQLAFIFHLRLLYVVTQGKVDCDGSVAAVNYIEARCALVTF